MVHKNIKIPLTVLRVAALNESCLSVFFARPAGFTYEPGDWMDLNFPDGNPRGGITYSFSSSPTEDALTITFRRGISPFKQRLEALQPGDELFISQYGNDYGFHLHEHRSSVLIAGGIGIAPFRSMLKEMSDTRSTNRVQLIYLNKGNAYVFAEELDAWRQQLPNIAIHYIDTTELNRKKREKLLTNTIDRHSHHYFIAGPEGMVEAAEHLLIDDMGIAIKDIRIDSFGGYA